jgi:hypothetical protein
MMSDYYDLGSFSRPVSMKSSEAQEWFDRGLIWYYAFNREESVRRFQRSAEHDPSCAMAYWGIASALGSEYTKRWDVFFGRGIETCRTQRQIGKRGGGRSGPGHIA